MKRARRRGSRGRSGSSGSSPQVQPSHGTPTPSGAASGRLHSPTIWWPGTSGSFGPRQLAVHDVQVGAADAAGAHAQQHLARARLRHGQVRSSSGSRCASSTIARTDRSYVRVACVAVQGLSRFVLRHKRLVVALWLLVLLGGVPNLQRATNALSQQFSVPGREGFETNVALFHRYGIDPSVSTIIPVFRLPAGTTVTHRASAPRSAQHSTATAAVPGSAPSRTRPRGAGIRLGRRAHDVRARLHPLQGEPRLHRHDGGDRRGPCRAAEGAARRRGGHVTGYDALNDSASGGKGPGVLLEALLGGFGALIVLAVVFASFIALVPIVMAVFAIVTTFMLIWALTTVANVSFYRRERPDQHERRDDGEHGHHDRDERDERREHDGEHDQRAEAAQQRLEQDARPLAAARRVVERVVAGDVHGSSGGTRLLQRGADCVRLRRRAREAAVRL